MDDSDSEVVVRCRSSASQPPTALSFAVLDPETDQRPTPALQQNKDVFFSDEGIGWVTEAETVVTRDQVGPFGLTVVCQGSNGISGRVTRAQVQIVLERKLFLTRRRFPHYSFV